MCCAPTTLAHGEEGEEEEDMGGWGEDRMWGSKRGRRVLWGYYHCGARWGNVRTAGGGEHRGRLGLRRLRREEQCCVWGFFFFPSTST
jgi:hypothetical protein